MTPETYEGYLYRGWRRSGTYLYKPNNWLSCCPALTIRLPVQKFQPSKSQRKVAKKMEHLLHPRPAGPQNPPSTATTNSSSLATASKTRGNKRKLHENSAHETTKESVELSQILDQLQKWSLPLLQSLLEGYATTNNLNTKSVTPVFKIKPLQGKNPKDSTVDDTTMTLCTTICAAIAGQSKGAVDRNRLSEQLTQQLKNNYVGKSISPPPNHGTPPSTCFWSLADVHRHAQSGQVFCVVQRTEAPLNGTNHTGSCSDDSFMKDATSTITLPQDKLQQWLDEHGDNMAPFSSTNGTLPHSPPYSFVVNTVPAHESALDPQVHKLYFLYQRKVHQDADPLTCDLNSTNLNNSSSSMAGHGPGDDSNAAPEDDEWSTPATSDGNDVIPPTIGRLTPPPPPSNNNNNNSNATNRNPPGFVDTAKRMLQREYAHVSRDRLKQITKSYGSFFQFLVESPFVIPLDPNTNGERRGARATVTGTPPSTLEANANPPQMINLPAGTYHQQYRVAGMLIAVGVVDVLPKGLSSVYLFYHPQFAHDLVPLGKYAILQEIEFSRALRLPYYYLGYYIESCTKMRYKAEYQPSELLCPTTYRWVDAMLSQRIIEAYSPVQHCCTLYYEDQAKLEVDLKQREHPHQPADKKTNGNNSPVSDRDDGDISMDDSTSSLGNNIINNNSNNSALPSRANRPRSQTASNHHSAASFKSPSSARSVASSTATKSILKKPNPSPFPANPFVDQVKMDVGVGVPVTLSMLHERGRETVRPLLEDFVKEAGPELSQKCLVKFS